MTLDHLLLKDTSEARLRALSTGIVTVGTTVALWIVCHTASSMFAAFCETVRAFA